MYIALIIWFLFLFVYIAFNVYGIIRVTQMRIRGDLTSTVILVYLMAIFLIVFISLIFISRLDWSATFRLFG
jgi:hypothetical protein